MKKDHNKRKPHTPKPANKRQDKTIAAPSNVVSQIPYWILGLAILFILIIRIRLLDVPLERDEGEYAYIGQQLLKGIPPFISIYHVKLPGIYAAYALIESLFGDTCSGIHKGVMIINILTMVVVFFIGKRLFNPMAGAIASICFGYMTISQYNFGFTANAEHFIMLPAMTGILLMMRGISLSNPKSSNPEEKTKFWNIPILNFLAAGLLLGVSYTMKQHAMLFILFAGIFFLYKWFVNKPLNFKNLFLNGSVMIIGIAIPFTMLCLYFKHLGLFDKFWWWTWVYPRTYATQISFNDGMTNFNASYKGIVNSTWSFEVLALAGLVITIIKGTWERRVFVIAFFLFSLAAVSVAFYFFQHYFLLVVPALAFMIAAAAFSISSSFKRNPDSFPAKYLGLSLVLLALIISSGYEKSYLFDLSPKDVSTNIYKGQPFFASQVWGKYIEQNSKPDDKIAILGSEPQLYFYSKRSAATGFVYTYEMMKDHPHAHDFELQMISEIEAAKPKYMLFVNVPTSWYSVALKNVDTTLFHWGFKYIDDHYKRVGIVDITENGGSFCWETQQSHCDPKTTNWMGMYIRNDSTAIKPTVQQVN